MNKRLVFISVLTLFVIIFTSCGGEAVPKNTGEPETTAPATLPEAGAETEAAVSSYADPLTKLMTEQNFENSRPLAISVKNDKAASPQFGLSRAAVIYEAPVEGGMTRFLAFYSDVSEAGLVGPVIDSRAYFFDFAANHNAVLVQAGSSAEGNKAETDREYDVLDALTGQMTPGFYRDNDLITQRGSENSILTDNGGLKQRASNGGISLKVDKQTVPYDVTDSRIQKDMSGSDGCSRITIPFSSNMNVEFAYSTLTDSYSRSQYGAPHTDAETGKQLAFTNLIIISADQYTVNETSGEISILNNGSGSGYYVYGGHYVKINWKRTSGKDPIKLYERDGHTTLSVSAGNTYIAVVSPRIFSRMKMD